jgi:hypothetical protein
MFNQLLINKQLIDGFCSNFYDTRFLCDYYHIENNIKGRCSIYFILLEHKIITNSKFEELEKIEEKTGPIYLITIDIHKLSTSLFKYSLYDVIYLPELIRKFLKMGWAYTHLIPEITCLINKFKRDPTNKFNNLDQQINPMNVYFIYDNDKNISLNEIWEIYWATIEDKYLEKIYQIGYFKKFIETIVKFIIYQNIFTHFKVYSNKKSLGKNINWNEYWELINQYPSFKKSINNYNHLVDLDIIDRIHN